MLIALSVTYFSVLNVHASVFYRPQPPPNKIGQFFKKLGRKLTGEEATAVALIDLDNLLFPSEGFICGPKESLSYGAKQGIGPENIVCTLKFHIDKNRDWKKEPNLKEKQEIEKNREALVNTYGEGSYEWAWFLNKLGEQDKSKAILRDLFEKWYAAIMKSSSFDDFSTDSPLQGPKLIAEILDSLGDTSGSADRKEKIRKMETHVINFPLGDHAVT